MICDLLLVFHNRTDKILFYWSNYCRQVHVHIHTYTIHHKYNIYIYISYTYIIGWKLSARNSTVNWFFTQMKYIRGIFHLFRTQFVQCSVTVVKEIPAHWFLSNLLSALSTKRTISDPETVLW